MIIHHCDGLAFAQGDGYLVSFLRRETTDEIVDLHLRTGLTLIDRPFVILSVIHSDSLPPTEKQKTAYRIASLKAGDRLRCYCALAVGRPGFVKVVRTVVVSMFQASFGFYRPCGFFEGLEQKSTAVQYLVDHAKFPLDTRDLMSDLEELLAHQE